jgi:hypothetical protein
MRKHFTGAQIKATLREAEAHGVTTVLARGDNHIIRLLEEYWDEGGAIQWVAQTASEIGNTVQAVNAAIGGGAKAVYIHGGVAEYLLSNGQEEQLRRATDRIQERGLPAGIAGHLPWLHQWAEEHLALDFYMCSYYCPTSRAHAADHVHGAEEVFDDADRDRMVAAIAGFSKPVIHYKILAAGRKDPREGFAFMARHLRPQDAVCVGVERAEMIAEDVAIFENALPTPTDARAAG